MTKNRTRQSTRRQAKKLIQAAILNGFSRDIDQFLEEQRQQVALDLIDEAAFLTTVSEEQTTHHAGSRKAPR